MNKLFLIITSLVIVSVAIFFSYETKEVQFENISFQAEIADSSAEHYNGLSNRNYLCGNCAMLFVFEDNTERSFVMREMMMPIDIVFINNNMVIDIHKDLKPEGKDYDNYYKSAGAVDMALEINANYSDKYNIKVGDKVIIN
ncbi:MAG: DUF192 domain-containing protein [Parcubacteria group bacterium]